jgi:glycosyltransferase involved in cell wall biosynthesis
LGRISPDNRDSRCAPGRACRCASAPASHCALKGDLNLQPDWEHYRNDIKPLLERGQATLIGEVAAALLFPIRWPEPFGLVMAEALACGTPVIALRDGSVPEVIEPWRNRLHLLERGGDGRSRVTPERD